MVMITIVMKGHTLDVKKLSICIATFHLKTLL